MVFVAVFVVAPVFSALVYMDATRRGLSEQKRLLWTFSVGILSFCGFLLPHRFETTVNLVYYQGIKPEPVAVSPYETLVLHLTVGVVISLISVLLYWVFRE